LGILTAFTVGGRLFDTWKESAPFFMFGVFGSLVAVWGLLIYRRVRPPREILEK
jgi:hypothetical protein